MSLFSNHPSLPSLARPRQKFATSIALSTPTSPKDISPFTKMFDSPKPFSLPKVNRSSLFNKSQNPLASPTGSDTLTKPRNFLGTTLQEITSATDVDTPGVRTVKFDLSSTEKVKSVVDEKKEETNECLRVITKNLREIGDIKRNLFKEMRVPTFDEKEKIAGYAEEAFSALNMRVKEIRKSYDDSAMSIEPIEEGQDLVNFYYSLIQEIAEFPLAFVSKLKIVMISICNDVNLCSSSYAQILKQKISNGLFVMNQLQTREAIREQWYRVVLYHLAKSNQTFLSKWKNLCGLVPSKRGEMDELIQTLKCVLRPEKTSRVGLFQAEEKIRFLKDELCKFEPMVLDEEWSNLKRREQMY